MQADNIKYRDLELLVCRAVDGTLTQDQMSKLNQMLADDDEAVKHYVDFLEIQVLVELNFSGTSEISMPVYDRDVQTLKDLWHQLSLEEQTAPAMELPEAESERELIQKVIRPVRRKRKVSKFQILSFISSAAAILCIIFFSKFLPPQPYSVEVATLVDQVDEEGVAEALPETAQHGTCYGQNRPAGSGL